ncbi:putative carbamoylphosphate synthase large subunit [Erysiphe necator]|uniref:Putative carbamoylphosphate synthase large subunit n=1 Tax=Uncinula necator TaxID=52586 RepID=A0A0B1P5Z5_UNCNE|nr:putative carbamoylphosphate synthase large subunit [Erysiphe necator]
MNKLEFKKKIVLDNNSQKYPSVIPLKMSILTENASLLNYNLLQCLLLLFNIIFLPYSACITISVLLLNKIGFLKAPRRILENKTPRVLVSGVGMSKGLFVARTMYLGGCDVYGIDFDNKNRNLYFGRFSTSIKRYISVPDPITEGVDEFISQVIEIIKNENINLWVSCTRVATPIDDAKLADAIRKQTNCKSFQFNEEVTSILDNKITFMRKTLELGVSRALWHSLSSYHDINNLLHKIKGSTVSGQAVRFLIKSANLDDSTRNLLPLVSSDNLRDAENVLKSLDFSQNHEWVLQEFIESQEEYCTNALIINGQVRAFTASRGKSVQMHYQPLNPNSILYENMMQFTQKYASALGDITGHMSFDFLVSYQKTRDGFEGKLVPIECNPRCHTVTILFHGKEVELADRYLESLYGKQNTPILETKHRVHVGHYWIAHDLVTLGALPILRLISGLASYSWTDEIQRILQLLEHIVTWKDQTFLWWDPLPWFVMNHLFWPLELYRLYIENIKWRMINVTTGKIFRKLN